MNSMDFDHKCGADDSLKYFQQIFQAKTPKINVFKQSIVNTN